MTATMKKKAHTNGRATPAPHTPASKGKLSHGEIVTWTVAGQRFPHKQVKDELAAAGLDPDVLKELHFRHGFARALHNLAEDRLIDLFDENKDVMQFQFNRRIRNDRGIEYPLETMLTLNKHTGKITCDIAELAAQAKAELDRAMNERTPGDVTQIVQRLFEQNADLFRIRDQGGAYFVPAAHVAFVDKIHHFLMQLNGTMRRYVITAGDPHTDKSIQETVAEGLAGMIRDHEKAVESFAMNTRQSTVDAEAERVKRTRLKIQAYAAYLDEKQRELLDSLADADDKLTERVKLLDIAWNSDTHTNCDHCGCEQGVPADATKWTCVECKKEFSLE